MKILFFTHYFPPEGNAPASRTYDNCRRWVSAGHKVTVITCAPNVPAGKVYDGYRNALYQREEVDGIEVIRVWTYIAANQGAARRILNYLSYMVTAGLSGLLAKRPDVIIATSPQFFCGLAGMLVGKLRRLPKILEVRDIWPESIHAVGAMKRSLLTRMLEWLELFMYHTSDTLVTVGSGYKKKLVERGVPEAKIEIITNGADLEFYCPGEPDADLRERYGIEKHFTAAYVGTIGMAAGLEVVLEAAALLREEGDDSLRFLLVGDGAERANLQARAEREGLKHVIFTGRVAKESIPGLLRSVDCCLIHLRKSELFTTVLPSKMFEAFAVGKAVILGVDGSAREILEVADAGLFIEPGSARALIDACRQFATNRSRMDRHAANGLNHVREFYDRDRLAERYLQVIESLVGREIKT